MRLKVIFLLFLLVLLFLPLITVLAETEQAATGLWEYNKEIPSKILEYYNLLVPIAGILATIMIMIGGAIWLSSGGNPERIGQAKGYISGAIIGLILALFSYSLLFYVNPNLVSLRPMPLYKVAKEDLLRICCDPKIGILNTETNEDCTKKGAVVCEENQTCRPMQASYIERQWQCVSIGVEEYYGICVPEGGGYDWLRGVERQIGGAGMTIMPYKCEDGMKCCNTCQCDPSKNICSNCSNFSWQTGIYEQYKQDHASPGIKQIADAIINDQLGIPITITSISDNNILSGECDITNWTDAGCQHSQNSCHYGGDARPPKEFSKAIDLKTSDSSGYLTLIYQVGSKFPDAKCCLEDSNHKCMHSLGNINHLHVNRNCVGGDPGLYDCLTLFRELIYEMN